MAPRIIRSAFAQSGLKIGARTALSACFLPRVEFARTRLSALLVTAFLETSLAFAWFAYFAVPSAFSRFIILSVLQLQGRRTRCEKDQGVAAFFLWCPASAVPHR